MSAACFSKRQLRALRGEADEQMEKMRGGRLWRNVDFLLYIGAVVLTALAIRCFLFEPIRVDGDSMIPTLEHGEHMFVEKVGYWFDAPARGDVVICFYPGYTESCVKRVIGLPGERVRITEGVVYIDDVPLGESAYWTGMMLSEMETRLVGENEIFVLGDNRNGSKDSRDPSVGNIPYAKIVGRVRAVMWPPAKMTAVRGVTY